MNLSASDETTGKDIYRRELVNGQSARLLCGYIYASAGDGESTQDVVYSCLLYTSYKQDGIEVVLPRHEQGLIHEAEGYARSTGKVGVCLVTSGPGATNIMTGLADAHYDLSLIHI